MAETRAGGVAQGGETPPLPPAGQELVELRGEGGRGEGEIARREGGRRNREWWRRRRGEEGGRKLEGERE